VPLDLRRERDLARILDDAFALYRAHWATLMAVALAVIVPVDLVVLGAGLGWLGDGYHGGTAAADRIVPLVAQWLIVTPLVVAMSIRVMVDVGEGRRPSAGTAIMAGLHVFAPLVATMVLLGLGVFTGMVALIVPGIVLGILWSMAAQVVVVEEVHGLGALRRSQALVRGSWWWTLGVWLVINLLASVFSLAIGLPLDAAAKAADSQAIVLLAEIAGTALTYPFVALALALAYFTLRVRNDERDDLPVDDPWARRRADGWEPPAPA
jgi:hypothetical protein